MTVAEDADMLPQEMWLQVLSWLPPREVLNTAALVSRRWFQLSREELLWHFICIRRSRLPTDLKPKSWRLFYFAPQNMLSNPSGEEKRTGWQFTNGGNGWAIETLDPDTAKRLGCQHNFASSYSWCIKKQTITLTAHGLDEAFLDSSPPIRVSEWFCARTDCRSIYQLTATLRDADHAVLATWTTGEKNAQTTWTKEEHVFRDYPAGVRSLEIESKGKDQQFWAGHYGAKMTAALASIAWDLKE